MKDKNMFFNLISGGSNTAGQLALLDETEADVAIAAACLPNQFR